MQQRVNEAMKEIIDYDVIDKHPITETSTWISNTVVTPKTDGSSHVTLDTKKHQQGQKSLSSLSSMKT